MNSWQVGLLIALTLITVLTAATAVWRARGLRRSWPEVLLAALLFSLVLPVLLYPDQWLRDLDQRSPERTLQLHVQMAHLANNSVSVQPNEYVSLLTGAPDQESRKEEFNDLHVARTLDSAGNNAAYGNVLPSSILLEVPESTASKIVAALMNKDKVPVYLYRQGLATVTRTSTPTKVPSPTGTPPTPTPTPTATLTPTPLPANLATFSLPVGKIVTDVPGLHKYLGTQITVLLVVEERDQERLTHAGYAYEARLLGFVDASGESIPGDALSGASAVLITLSRDEKDVRTAEFAAGLASASAIHILPASTISTSTPELTPKE